VAVALREAKEDLSAKVVKDNQNLAYVLKSFLRWYFLMPPFFISAL